MNTTNNYENLWVCRNLPPLLIHIVRKGTPRFTKSPSLVLIGPVLTEILAFKNVKRTKKCMEMRTNPDISPDLSAFPYISLYIFCVFKVAQNSLQYLDFDGLLQPLFIT